MGIVNTKDYMSKKKIDQATSNSSLLNLRYVITKKPKWKVFRKKEIVPLLPNRRAYRCQCGNVAPCKKNVTPGGVTLYYPRSKKRNLGACRHKRYTRSKIDKHYFNSPRKVQKGKLIRQKFPRWRLDQMSYKTPFATLLHLRDVITEKPKLKMFKKKEIVLLPLNRGANRCQRGSVAPCKKKGTPGGVTLHYPQSKKRNLDACRRKRYTRSKIDKLYFNSPRKVQQAKLIRQKKIPTWKLDQMSYKTSSATHAPPSRASTPPPVTESASISNLRDVIAEMPIWNELKNKDSAPPFSSSTPPPFSSSTPPPFSSSTPPPVTESAM